MIRFLFVRMLNMFTYRLRHRLGREWLNDGFIYDDFLLGYMILTMMMYGLIILLRE